MVQAIEVLLFLQSPKLTYITLFAVRTLPPNRPNSALKSKPTNSLLCKQSAENNDEPCRDRTCDPLVKSQMLYRLS